MYISMEILAQVISCGMWFYIGMQYMRKGFKSKHFWNQILNHLWLCSNEVTQANHKWHFIVNPIYGFHCICGSHYTTNIDIVKKINLRDYLSQRFEKSSFGTTKAIPQDRDYYSKKAVACLAWLFFQLGWKESFVMRYGDLELSNFRYVEYLEFFM